MKRIVVALAALMVAASALGQSGPLGYFQLTDDAHVIWQCVYESSLNVQAADHRLKVEGFRILDSTDDLIVFYCDGLHISPEEFGYSRGETPMYVTGKDLAFRGFIQFKEGRYRVTLDRILGIDNTTTAGGVFVKGSVEPFETNALDGREFSRGFQKIPARIYNTALTRIFLLMDPEAANHMGHDW